MTTGYDAGTSVGRYILQADAALRTQQALIRGYQQLGKAASVRPPTLAAPNTSGIQQATLAQQRLATEQQKTAISAQRLATEQQKTSVAVTSAARANQQLARDTANAAAAQDRAAQAALRRQQAEARARQNGGLGPALPRTFAGITSGGAAQLAGLAGGAFSIDAAIGAGQNALRLRETQNTLRALSGDTKTYTSILATARQQQELFGGSLQENIAGLQGLVITSRSTGAELNTLIGLSQRLAILDPAQGAEGARIALSEVLAGDPRSLARRYEIPLSALEKIRDESIPVAERLLILDQYLAKIGITAEAVKAGIDKDALAFRRAAAEIEEATVKLGNFGATLAAIPARGLTELLDTGSITGGAAAAGTDLQGSLIAQASDFAAYAKSIRDSNDQIGEAFKGDPLAAFIARQRFGLEQLNPVQFAYAQSLIQTGTAATDAIAKARALGDVTDILTQQTQGGNAAFTALVPTMAQAASSSQENASQVLALNSAYLQGQISIDVLKLALEGIVRAQELAAQASFQEEREMRALERSFVDVVPAANAAAAAIRGVASAGALTRGEQAAAAQATTGNALGLGGILGGGAGTTFSRVDAQQQALQASRDALALSRAKTSAERLAIFQRQLDRQTTEEGRNRILAQIEAEKKTRAEGAAGGRGISALDRSELALIEDKQAALDEVNRRLAAGNLTQLQRNQLLDRQQTLERQIAEEKEKQARASIDAQLGAVKDAQARLKEAREAAGLQRALGAGRLSGEQSEAVRLRLAEINLEQQKRALDIQKDQRDAGFAPQQQAVAAQQQAQALRNVPAITAPLPIPNLAALPSVQQGQTVVNITLNVDKNGAVTASAPDPNVVLNILQSSVSFRNLSGGA